MDSDTSSFNFCIISFKGDIIVSIGYSYDNMLDNLYTQIAIKESRN